MDYRCRPAKLPQRNVSAREIDRFLLSPNFSVPSTFKVFNNLGNLLAPLTQATYEVRSRFHHGRGRDPAGESGVRL